MNGLLFTNQALLGGLALLAVPILIHLLLRIKKKRLRFSTLQFFLRHDEQATRRRKLRNWLLLAVRVLILLLIVTAFARPYLAANGRRPRLTPPKQVVIVLDRSASMAAVEREGQRWDRAKVSIRKRLAQLGSDDRVALIGCAARVETLIEPGPVNDVLKRLDTLDLTHGTADLGKGLQQAAQLVSQTGSAFTNSICIVSDLQRSSCQNLASYPIPKETSLEVLNIGDVFSPNVAVTDLLVKPADGSKPSVTVVNSSEDDFPTINLQFVVDGRELSAFSLHLPGGASTNVPLALGSTGPGWHSAEARIQVQDTQALDNTCYGTFYTAPRIHLLVVEPRQVPKQFQEESFFLVSALDPMFGAKPEPGVASKPADSDRGSSPFVLEKIPPTDLVARLQRHNSPSPYDVVVLPGLKAVTAGVASALNAFVKDGGGVLFFLNDAISLNRYNTDLPELLPVSLEKFETATDLDWRLWEHDQNSPVFAPFVAPNSGNLGLSKFTRRADLRPCPGAVVLARFQDGLPLLVERTLGQGRVLLVNSSADTAWSDWPKHRTFVPWVHGLARFLANRNAEPPEPRHALSAGSETELEFGRQFKNQQLVLLGPGGKQLPAGADEQGSLRDVEFVNSGFYSIRSAQGQELSRVAANIPIAESDLGAMSPSEFERQVGRLETSPRGSGVAALFGSVDGRLELWPWLLLSGLILLPLELLLANRTLA